MKNFKEFYVLNEITQERKSLSFISRVFNPRDWAEKIFTIILLSTQIKTQEKDLLFILCNSNESFVIRLKYSFDTQRFHYFLSNRAELKLQELGLIHIKPSPDVKGFYYNAYDNQFEYKAEGKFDYVPRSFPAEKLMHFLSFMQAMTKRVGEEKEKEILSFLGFVDEFSYEDSKKLMELRRTPLWLVQALKPSNTRDKNTGFFRGLFR